WFMHWFKAEAKSSVVHRDQRPGAEFEKCLDCFLWIHVNFAASWRFVRTDRKQRNLNSVAIANFSKAGKVGTVAAVKNGAAVCRDHKSAEVPMQIRQKSCAPVMTGCQRNFERAKLDCLPVIELVHNVEAEIVNQVTYAHRHNDRLVGRYAAQRTPVEMIEMSMSHQDEINRWQMMNFESRLLQTLDYLEPLRPVRIDQDIHFVSLNKKRRVADPRNTNLAFSNFWELRRPRCLITRPSNKKGRNQDAGKKIAFMPVGSWTQPDSGRTLGYRIIRRLANNVSPALLWKTNWHDVQTI